eukprot:Seg2620.3 transcript_id=Seg2620.3/GoldUCD/mRNA.D3Y31 product="Protein zwilch-like" protein_id=Seg2620.3/GoldUCD/D3Y31
MASQRHVDVSSFSGILEKLLLQEAKKNDGETQDTHENKFISFKEQFSLNYARVGKEEASTTILGLEDVLGLCGLNDSSDGDNLLLASKHVENVTIGHSFNDSDTTGTEYHTDELSSGDITQQSQQGAKISFGNNVKNLSEEMIIRAGPTSTAQVQFMTGSSQLQFIGGESTKQILEVEQLEPMTLRDARYLVSVFAQAVTNLKGKLGDFEFWNLEFPWLLVKCDAKIPQMIGWICCKIENVVDEGDQKVLLKSFLIKEKNAITDAEEMLQKQLGMQDKGSKNSFYFSRYNLLGSIFKQEVLDVKESGQLYLEFAWQEPTLPFQPPPLTADAVAKFRIVPSDPCSPLAPVYLELIELESIIHNISKCNWPDFTAPSEKPYDIIEHVPEFLEDLKTVKYAEEVDVEKHDETNDLASPLLTYVLDSFRRNDWDFTDRLWEFLKNAKSFEEVMQCLDHIFVAICTREIQPVFNTENKTQMASWIRKFYKASNQAKGKEELQEKVDGIMESPSKVFQMIADIGLEKYNRDYVSFFVNEELATFGQLEPMMRHANTLEERMAVIWKFHHSLELVAVSKAYLSLDVDYLRIILRASLDYYKNMAKLSTSPIFSVSIPAVSSSAAAIIDRCRSMKPVMWKWAAKKLVAKQQAEVLSMLIFSEDNTDINIDFTANESVDIPALHKAVIVEESQLRIY